LRGPCWFYGTASEHIVLYHYQLLDEKDIFLGYRQTETPYMQLKPGALKLFKPSSALCDPAFPDCGDDNIGYEMSWALRVLSSRDIFIYSTALYSFFSGYTQDCLKGETCQNGLVETSYTQGLWLYNLFTVGAIRAVSPRGGSTPVW
jgi:glucan 1,3-beta-glucosidase